MKRLLLAGLLVAGAAHAGTIEKGVAVCGDYTVRSYSAMTPTSNKTIIRVNQNGKALVNFTDDKGKLFKIAWGLDGAIDENFNWNGSGDDIFILTSYPDKDPQAELHINGNVIHCEQVGRDTDSV
ncbi:hypothetical protein PGN80_13160 [Klebsiella aerogenes]|uniref:hypothetical protein n=1 Tax=Klebsiella aerogenes TaxID=548 RepID=UPI00301E1DE5